MRKKIIAIGLLLTLFCNSYSSEIREVKMIDEMFTPAVTEEALPPHNAENTAEEAPTQVEEPTVPVEQQAPKPQELPKEKTPVKEIQAPKPVAKKPVKEVKHEVVKGAEVSKSIEDNYAN